VTTKASHWGQGERARERSTVISRAIYILEGVRELEGGGACGEDGLKTWIEALVAPEMRKSCNRRVCSGKFQEPKFCEVLSRN